MNEKKAAPFKSACTIMQSFISSKMKSKRSARQSVENNLRRHGRAGDVVNAKKCLMQLIEIDLSIAAANRLVDNVSTLKSDVEFFINTKDSIPEYTQQALDSLAAIKAIESNRTYVDAINRFINARPVKDHVPVPRDVEILWGKRADESDTAKNYLNYLETIPEISGVIDMMFPNSMQQIIPPGIPSYQQPNYQPQQMPMQPGMPYPQPGVPYPQMPMQPGVPYPQPGIPYPMQQQFVPYQQPYPQDQMYQPQNPMFPPPGMPMAPAGNPYGEDFSSDNFASVYPNQKPPE